MRAWQTPRIPLPTSPTESGQPPFFAVPPSLAKFSDGDESLRELGSGAQAAPRGALARRPNRSLARHAPTRRNTPPKFPATLLEPVQSRLREELQGIWA